MIVIGTSAGGFIALDELVQQFKKENDACYCIVMHLSNPNVRSSLVKRLQALTNLPCHVAEEGLQMQKGNVYIAQPGSHLLVRDGKLMLGCGMEQDAHRPSIDVLFRSAAADYDMHAIGIVLTGCVQDGTSGMQAIKGYGGTLIIQNPTNAEYAGMPLSVNNNSDVDYCVDIKNIGAVITNIIQQKNTASNIVSPELASEVRWSQRMAMGIGTNDEKQEKTLHPCPDCGQPLKIVENDGQLWYYCCPLGHVCFEEDAMDAKTNASEGMWVALRLMDDRMIMLINKAAESQKKQMFKMAAQFSKKAANLKKYIDQLKGLLMEMELPLKIAAT